MNEITVFGASGFIGRHVVRRLAKTGATIRVPTRNPEKALTLKPMGDVGQIVPFFCSTRNDTSVLEAIGQSETVINLIGILFEKGKDNFQSMHVETAARIARLAKERHVKKLIHISALGAKSPSSSKYATSKAFGEQAVKAFFPNVTIIRPSIVFGPEDNFFNLFASLACYLPGLPLIGGGRTKFQPVYVGDVAEAVLAILKNPQAAGKVYELGGPTIYSFRELLELILKEIGRKRCLINLPWSIAKLEASFLQLMPNPLLTRDQVELLKEDNVIMDNNKINTLETLSINPTAVEVIIPTYLKRYSKKRAA